jgi:hypothetical protein
MGSRHHHAILKRATLNDHEETEVAGKNCIVQKNRDQRGHSPAAKRAMPGESGKKLAPQGCHQVASPPTNKPFQCLLWNGQNRNKNREMNHGIA